MRPTDLRFWRRRAQGDGFRRVHLGLRAVAGPGRAPAVAGCRLLALAITAVLGCQSSSADPAGAAQVTVDPAVRVADVRRIGINLGTWAAWGANQLCQNVLQNPGLEGTISRAIVIVRSVDGSRFSDDVTYLGWPDDFWRGSMFDVRTGAAAGTQGTLVDSQHSGPDGYPTYTASAAVPGLAPGDVVALTRTDDAGAVERWMAGDHVLPAVGDVRPGSPGRRSLALVADGATTTDMVTYLDSIGDRAGKLLPVEGRWRLSFWSKAAGASMDLRVRFLRQGSAAFVDHDFEPGPAWQLTTLDFDAVDNGPPGTLEVHFWVRGGGRVFLDDVSLGAVGETPGGFRGAVVDALRALRPGFLRDWQGGQGFTLENRLVPDFARRVTRCSPALTSTFFEYGLPNFLELCRAIGADPWVVAPTTFSDSELRGLGRSIVARAASAGFDDVVIEFGNENWNQLSRPSGITNPAAYGPAAQRAFGLLREAGAPMLRTAVNGQFANPPAALDFARVAPQADILGVAPYFLFSLDAGLTPAQRLAALNPGDTGNFAALSAGLGGGPELAVYEVNLHTTGGNAPAAERDPTVGGTAAGAALARRIMQAQAAGARRIMAYELAGYDTWTDDHAGFVRLWGLARDLGPTRRLRSTGLAVAMLNQVIGGDLHRVDVEPPATDLTVAAYRTAQGWSGAVASIRDVPVPVTLTFPVRPPAPLPVRALSLRAADPWATNDATEAVRMVDIEMRTSGSAVSVVVPPAGIVVLVPPGAAP